MSEFLEDDVGDEDFLEEPKQDLDLPNKNEIVDGASVTDDQPHLYKPSFRSVACSRSKSSML